MDPENITLKPIPPEIWICCVFRNAFSSTLRLNGKFIDPVMNAAKFRSDYKQLINDLK